MKKCIECGNEFEPKNPKGKFCTPNCRQKNYRKSVADLLKKARSPIVQDLNRPTDQVEPISQPTTNFVIDTTTEKQIKELEEKIKLVPNGQYYNKVVAGLRSQINKLKNQK